MLIKMIYFILFLFLIVLIVVLILTLARIHNAKVVVSTPLWDHGRKISNIQAVVDSGYTWCNLIVALSWWSDYQPGTSMRKL